ncbi:AAA family ATPase [Flavobacterium algicola]|uniref:AAA family ATPase n=1 Tax=Flavobacterium algicola TaxID=556529 RepID=UPI001EFE1D18|nr:ATP-binding protein [Flavobacterium algicola]MCG9791146.1 ATP-binding protein [Flavobacterium algicola]
MQKNIILLIGGPGTGKSSILNELKDKGFCCYPEISREITLEAQKNGIDQLFLEQPLLFSQLLLEGRQKQHQEATQEADKTVFIDRGLPDILAYMHFAKQDYPEHFTTSCQDHRYTKIFMLAPWEEIYVIDDARYETYEQALDVHQHIVDTYKSFGYDPIEVPRDTIENRTAYILNAIQNEL